MKALSLIVALLVVVLSVVPCCYDADCAAEDALTEQMDNQDNEAEACSPFYSCATCIGFTVSNYVVEWPTPVGYFNKHIINFQQGYLPAFSIAIWQPPKIG